MNLSLYLPLAAESEIEPNFPAVEIGADIAAGLIASRAANQDLPATMAVYDPGCIASKSLLQASYRQAQMTRTKPITGGVLRFSASVLANTLGFLLMTSGLLLLLQTAQASLG